MSEPVSTRHVEDRPRRGRAVARLEPGMQPGDKLKCWVCRTNEAEVWGRRENGDLVPICAGCEEHLHG